MRTDKQKASRRRYMNTEKGREKARLGQLRFQRARYAWIKTLKASPCMDCGGIFPPECMDFDHVRGQKLFGICGNRTRTYEAVLNEIAKCDLVCANCHRIRHKRRPRGGLHAVSNS